MEVLLSFLCKLLTSNGEPSSTTGAPRCDKGVPRHTSAGDLPELPHLKSMVVEVGLPIICFALSFKETALRGVRGVRGVRGDAQALEEPLDNGDAPLGSTLAFACPQVGLLVVVAYTGA